MGTSLEAQPSQAVDGAPGARDRPRRAAAEAPRPLGRLARVPGQVPAHATATPVPGPSPIPLCPPIAAPSTPDPGVPRLDARRPFGQAHGGVPSLEVPPPSAHDAYQRLPARAARPAASLGLARLQGLVAHPAPVRPSPRARQAQQRPPPRPVHRTVGRLDCPLQAPCQEPRHPGPPPLAGASARAGDGASVRIAPAPGPPPRQLLVQTVPPQSGSHGRPGTPWRGPYHRRLQARVRPRPGREVAVAARHHPSVRDPRLDPAPPLVVVDPVAALLDVQVDHPAVALPHIPLGWRHRLMRRAPRTAPLAARRQGRGPCRRPPLPPRVLDAPVPPGGHPACAYPAPRRRDLHPLPRRRSVRPGHPRVPELWPLRPQVPRSPFDGPPVPTWAAALPLPTGEGRAEVPPLHDPCHPAHLPTRSVAGRCFNRGFTPPRRDGPLERRCRGVASVPPPVRPPAHRSGRPPAPAGLRYPLLTAACRSARMPPRAVRLGCFARANRRPTSQGQTPHCPGVDAGGIKPTQGAEGGRRGHVPTRPEWSHPSSPVPGRRPARVAGAASRRHLAMTPWPCSSPSAPRTPGTGTSTP
jgi:hypothetical protein